MCSKKNCPKEAYMRTSYKVVCVVGLHVLCLLTCTLLKYRIIELLI